MKIARKSSISGKTNVMDLPVTQEQIDRCWSLSPTGTEHIQNVFPDLSADQREFLKTGITPEEWEAEFGSFDEEDDVDAVAAALADAQRDAEYEDTVSGEEGSEQSDPYGIHSEEANYAALEEILRRYVREASRATGDEDDREGALQDARDLALKEILARCDTDEDTEKYMDFFDTAYHDATATLPPAENSTETNEDTEYRISELEETLRKLAREASLVYGDDDAREDALQDARDSALEEILGHKEYIGDDEERYMDFFDNAYATECDSYDARNLRKPVAANNGELNPGIYSVDDDVFRVGDSGTLAQFRHGKWRSVRAAGEKQDSEYKLKRRGEHTKASILKTLGKTSEACLLCGKPLEDDDSVARGVGSSCARKYGIL